MGAPENPCPICGAQSFVWGRPVARWYLNFQPLRNAYATGMAARRCENCGNVQLFLEDALPPEHQYRLYQNEKRKGFWGIFER